MRIRNLTLAVLSLVLLCGLAPGQAPDGAGGSQIYVKGGTWQATMLEARAKYQTWRTGQLGGNAVTFGPWYITRPLKAKAFTDTFFPEQNVNLESKMPDGATVWSRRDDFVEGIGHSLPEDAPAATYLFRVITSAAPMTLKAGLGSDDGLEVWINGAKVLSKDVPRVVSPDADKIDLALVAGENRLLLKVYNGAGGCGFYFSLQDDPVLATWQQIEKDFPVESAWVTHDNPDDVQLAWFTLPENKEAQKGTIVRVLDAIGESGAPLRQELAALETAPSGDPRWLDLYVKSCKFRKAMADMQSINLQALRLAIEDLDKSFPGQYTKAPEFLARLDAYEKQMPEIQQALITGSDDVRKPIDSMLALQREALLANPLMNIDRLLLVKRGENNIGLPQNWQGNCAMSSRGYDNEIATLCPKDPEGKTTTFYKPDNGAFVGDIDLGFEADKMLFSMPGSHDRWQIWEIKSDGTGLRQVTLGEEPDVDNYDACYLPDERITFASTRCFQGVPCVGGGNTVANFCRMDADGSNARQLCFDQDHNWCPTVLNNGRLLYSRWEYSDTPHYFSRLLFNMNPDGTNQCEYYGSNSYWPNSTFYARPIPGSASAVVAIISGHHGVARMGELVILDPGKGRLEGAAVVQRIPGYGKKVEPVIMDTLVDAVWPKFLHPYPLSDKYFLVSCKPTPDSLWGIYLVDVFDNMLLLAQQPGYALLEPLPFRKTERPPVIPDRVKPDRGDATVYLADVYRGQGLAGVPRGTVKSLRVYEFHYTYPKIGGHMNIGVEGPWDVHRILGTVPVYDDGSAHFKVPANIPVAVQPLDSEGRAVQVMRSWFVGMPGESISCVGCHERQNMTPPSTQNLAAKSAPADITPWKGPARGFSFKRDVQPVLDRFCVGCHGGQERKDGQKIPDLSRKDKNGESNFTPSYLALHPYVRRPGPESDYHVQKPTEFHASTSPLVQMIEKGHYGVKLDSDAWDRLYTWIDLNVPDHGTWHEQTTIPENFHDRRIEMRTKYASRPEDPEAIPDLKQDPVAFVAPERASRGRASKAKCDGWPFDLTMAAGLQKGAGSEARRTIDLGNGVTMDLALIPKGAFVMGSADGNDDERPCASVIIDEPFWMGVVEVTNAQYQQFDPKHDSGFIDQAQKDHTTPGYPAQAPNNPAIRMSWNEAADFCRWLSAKTGQACMLPTEAQWEWACRAGSETPLWYGDLDADFSKCANLADASISLLAVQGINPQPIPNPTPFQDFLPKDARFNDGAKIVTEVGKYQPNPWGLCDMHGNVAEWTASAYRPYPYVASDGRNDPSASGKKVVRGGSWFDRPKTASSAYRLAYESWQPVYNVGFRVVLKAGDNAKIALRSAP